MNADDIPATSTRSVYQHPTAKVPQSVFADLFAIAWDDIAALVHEQDDLRMIRDTAASNS